jgi:pimeloyl-ACP methyl ester carboxylesterase
MRWPSTCCRCRRAPRDCWTTRGWGKGLRPYPLETIQAPTLAISARDDGFGTFAGAQYTASRIPGSRFIGHEQGGHLLIGHDEDTRAAIVEWIRASAGR